MFFRFFDMASGGRDKTKYETIIIEADNEEQAAQVFEDKFEIDPYNTTCDCCGPDYSISEYETLELAERFDKDSRKKITYTKEPA